MQIIIHTSAIKKTMIDVNSLAEAQQKWKDHRDGGNDLCEYLGASDMRGQCGAVLEDDKIIAEISYNGRAWDMNGNEIKETKKPTISMTDFYNLPEVVEQINIQKTTPFRNPAHKASAYKIIEIAKGYGAEQYFGDPEEDYKFED